MFPSGEEDVQDSGQGFKWDLALQGSDPLDGQTDPMMGSGNLLFRILSHTSFTMTSTVLPHRAHEAACIATPVSHPFTVRPKGGLPQGPVFSLSPSSIALETVECGLEAI